MSKPNILISESLSQAAIDWLCDQCAADYKIVFKSPSESGFDDVLARAHALIVRTYTIVDTDLLKRAPNLKVIARAGVGLDNIDLGECKNRGISVVHTPHANAMAVVEYTISMILNTLRPIERIGAEYAPNDWHDMRQRAITPDSVVNTTLGILGLGHIGSRVARAASALDIQVSYTDLLDIPESDRYGSLAVPKSELLTQSRVISIHVDGRKENKHLIDDAAFAQMQPNTILINASRGFVVDPDAAARFASTNPDARLILDVHDPEPIDPHSPLIHLPNVILTPHIAAATAHAKLEMSMVVRDVWRVLNDQPPIHPAPLA